MTYDTIAAISQVTSLLMFMAMFFAVIAYVFWPGNRRHFETAQQRALDLDPTRGRSSGRHNGDRT